MRKRKHYNIDLDAITREEAVLLKAGFMPQRLVEQEQYFEPVDEADANVVSSRVEGDLVDWHMPVLDIDFPAKLVTSSTEDHYHLFLDIEVPWDKYKNLLDALRDCGIISKGYHAASVAREATFVRKPGVFKTKKSPSS